MYRFQVEYGFEDYLAFNRVHEKTKGRKQAVQFVFLVTFILDVLVAVAVCIAGQWESMRWILPLATVIGIVVTRKQSSKTNAKISQRLSRKNIGELIVFLDDEGVECRASNEKTQYLWSAFIDGYYHRGYYLLYIGEKHAIILPEHALVEGDPATLRAFLEEKLQKEVKEIP